MWAPKLSPKQLDFYLSPKRFKCAAGPRGVGKTWGIEHEVMKHLWRFRSRAAIVVKTNRAGSLGVWPEITTTIFEEWDAAGIGSKEADFSWATTPRQDPTSKIRYCKIWNRHGTQSELVLFPIERSEDAKEKLLSTQFSLIWLSEAHLYETDELYRIATGQLRLPSVPYEDTRLICDCNPPDEGPDHWLYKVFEEERNLPEEEFDPLWDERTRRAFKKRQSETQIWYFNAADNPFAPDLVDSFRATYARNPVDYQRFVEGKWIKVASAGSFFKSVFFRELHVFGNTDAKDEADWETLWPSDSPAAHRERGKLVIACGWDPGDVNHAWVAVQPWTNAANKLCFDVVDEHVVLDEEVSLDKFTVDVMEHMANLENACQEEYRWRKDPDGAFVWEHYSDSSVDDFRAAADDGDVPTDESSTDAGIIYAASKMKIELQGASAVKKGGWQRKRVNFIQQLLRENRIRVSAHCFRVIEMLERLRRNPGKSTSVYIAPGQPEKHAFDALSYVIAMLCIEEINAVGDERPKVGRMISG